MAVGRSEHLFLKSLAQRDGASREICQQANIRAFQKQSASDFYLNKFFRKLQKPPEDAGAGSDVV